MPLIPQSCGFIGGLGLLNLNRLVGTLLVVPRSRVRVACIYILWRIYPLRRISQPPCFLNFFPREIRFVVIRPASVPTCMAIPTFVRT